MSDEIEVSCYTCFKSINGRPDPRTDDRHPGGCWACCRLSSWEPKMEYYEDFQAGRKVIAKKVRPVYTVWNPETVHKDIKSRVRRSRRIFKQYLKTGSLRLLKAAERKITSWDFD